MSAVMRRCFVLVLLAAAACMRTLPDQDLRIRNAVAVAKMSPADLWQDFQKDAAAAHRQYWGKAIEISGKATSADAPDAAAPAVFFAQAETRGVRARLLIDDAPEILKVASSGQRITLKCFCEGLHTDLILKSCVLTQVR
jgi:hypothetical protein